MSASERLREIGGKFEGLRIGDTPPPVIEILFWDELVAVVEAAEDPGLADIFDDTTMFPAQKRLAAALLALREHLEGQ